MTLPARGADPSLSLRGLSAVVHAEFARWIPRGSRVALLDFPEYGNVGDSAIWLGELKALRRAGATVAYAAGQSTYDAAELRRRIGPDGTILLTGGGNFGDLWPRHFVFRQKVLAEHRDVPIIQLPQSIQFIDPNAVADTSAALRAHGRVTLLVRDEVSLRLAEETLRFPAVLCPDAAMALGPLPRPTRPDRPIVWLSRDDREGPLAPVPDDEVKRVDWVDEPTRLLRSTRLARRWERLGGRVPLSLRPRLLRDLCRARVREGSLLLSRGRVVVTNRLHAMILALLMGIPHFVSDTRFGKIAAFHRSWLSEISPGVICASESEALERGKAHARSLGQMAAHAGR